MAVVTSGYVWLRGKSNDIIVIFQLIIAMVTWLRHICKNKNYFFLF